MNLKTEGNVISTIIYFKKIQRRDDGAGRFLARCNCHVSVDVFDEIFDVIPEVTR